MPKITNNLLNNLPLKVIAPVVAPSALNSRVVLRDRIPKGFANVPRRASSEGIWLCPPRLATRSAGSGFLGKLGCRRESLSWPSGDTLWLEVWQPGVTAFSGPPRDDCPSQGLHTSRPARAALELRPLPPGKQGFPADPLSPLGLLLISQRHGQ